MKVYPVNGYEGPKYPTRSILDEHPELLALVPKSWQASPVVLTALSSLCLLAAGLRAFSDDKSSAPKVRVAPVFQHGEGRGAFGCKVINPPVFLSEDEAKSVIVEEAKRAGIDLTDKGSELPDVLMENYVFDPSKTEQQKTRKVQLDGTDTKRHVSYEYVSTEDSRKWSKPAACSVYSVDTRNLADRLRNRLLKTHQGGYYVVFYDPLTKISRTKGKDQKQVLTIKNFEAARVEAEEKAREQLRSQVRDFVKWLKAQGVV